MKSFRDMSLIRKIIFFIASGLALVAAVFVLISFKIDNLPENVTKYLNEKYLLLACLALEFLICAFSMCFKFRSLLTGIAFVTYVIGAAILAFVGVEKVWAVAAVVGALLAFQVCMLLYALFCVKGIGFKVFEIAIRVILTAVVYFVLPGVFPQYLENLTNILFAIYLINAVITLVSLVIHVKKSGMLFIANLLLLLGAAFYGLKMGGLDLFGIGGALANFVEMFNWGFLFIVLGGYCYALDLFFYDENAQE